MLNAVDFEVKGSVFWFSAGRHRLLWFLVITVSGVRLLVGSHVP